MLKQFVAAVAGGLMIAIGGCVYLNTQYTYLTTQISTVDTYVGAFFFAVALICICMKGYGLFTGRIGYLADNRTLDELKGVSMTLLGNAVATFFIGALVSLTMADTLGAVALYAVVKKLGVTWYVNLIRAILCGVLMYLAVSIYREKNSVLGIVFCVPAFIIAGFEHSIADMFYFAASGYRDWDGLLVLVIAIIGNAIGGMLLPVLAWACKDAPAEEEAEENEADEAAEEADEAAPEFEVEVEVTADTTATEGDAE